MQPWRNIFEKLEGFLRIRFTFFVYATEKTVSQSRTGKYTISIVLVINVKSTLETNIRATNMNLAKPVALWRYGWFTQTYVNRHDWAILRIQWREEITHGILVPSRTSDEHEMCVFSVLHDQKGSFLNIFVLLYSVVIEWYI